MVEALRGKAHEMIKSFLSHSKTATEVARLRGSKHAFSCFSLWFQTYSQISNATIVRGSRRTLASINNS